MRYRCMSIALLILLSTSAYAIDVPFGVKWNPVTAKVNGHSIIVSSYRVYVCNQSINKTAIGAPVVCSGHMQSYTTSQTSMQGVYDSPQDKGTLRIRVSAIDLNGLESLLSGTRNLPFDMTSPANAPGTPTIDYTGKMTDPDIVEVDTTPPDVALTAPVAGVTVSGSIPMSATASDNVAVAQVEFFVDGGSKGVDTNPPFSITWDTENGGTHPCNGPHTHTLHAVATDTSSNTNASSDTLVYMNDPAYCNDTEPPSAPTGLQALVISSSQINLSWTASTDNVGVIGYQVESCDGESCTDFSQISAPTGTAYNHTGLIAETDYLYRVRAMDAAGNPSSYSSIVNATTQQESTVQSISLDNFESGIIREVQPNDSYPGYRYLWNLYTDPVNSPSTISNEDAYEGNLSLKNVYNGSSNWQYQFYTYTIGMPGLPQNGWQYAKKFVNGTWINNTYNRLRFWIKLPIGTDMFGSGSRNFNFGTYTRCSTCSMQSAESSNGHWYHFADLPFTGEWHQIIIDMRPDHQRSYPGDHEHGVVEHPTGEAEYNYFDLLTRFYMDFPYSSWPLPATFYLDGFEFYRESNVENDAQVSTINGVYVLSNNAFRLGWQRNKNDITINHEVRYAFSDIHLSGWNAATPAPNGVVAPLNTAKGYNGMEYSTMSIDTLGMPIVYFAVKPQNSSLFKQIAIPISN